MAPDTIAPCRSSRRVVSSSSFTVTVDDDRLSHIVHPRFEWSAMAHHSVHLPICKTCMPPFLQLHARVPACPRARVPA